MKGCGWTLPDGVRLVPFTVFQALLASPFAFTRTLREEKDRGLMNPAFPRDRGDIHERESAGIERQTGTQKERRGEGREGVQ